MTLRLDFQGLCHNKDKDPQLEDPKNMFIVQGPYGLYAVLH